MVAPNEKYIHSKSRLHDQPHTIKNRFYANVLLPDERGCMIWSGYKNKQGYGHLRGFDEKMILAHRFSYALHFGPFDSSLCVLHHCDNPSCVSPEHLFLGTRKDNMQDCSRKGRIGGTAKINILRKNNDK